jgi:hypothetical protein
MGWNGFSDMSYNYLDFVFLIGSVFVALIALRHPRLHAPWTRWAFFTIAALMIVQAVNDLGGDNHLWPVHDGMRRIISGFCLGIFYTLFVSGELFVRKTPTKERIT